MDDTELNENAPITAANQIPGNMDDAEGDGQVIDANRPMLPLENLDKFSTWFFANLHRECLNHRRWRCLLNENDELPIMPPSEEEGFLALFNRLSLDHRKVLIARYLDELSYDEMAVIFRGNEQTMRTCCFQACEKLYMMAEEEEEEARRILHGVSQNIIADFPLVSFREHIAQMIRSFSQVQMPGYLYDGPPDRDEA